MRWKLRDLIVACTLAAISGGCTFSEPRTEVMLFIDADPSVRALAVDLQLSIEGRNSFDRVDGPLWSYQFRPKELGSTGWPFSVGLVPRTREPGRSYVVTAVISDGTNTVGVVRAQSGFVTRKTVALQLSFKADCLNAASLSCSNQETCQNGSCVSASVDASTLPEFNVSASISTHIATAGGMAPTSDQPAAADAGGLSVDASPPAPRSDAAGECGDGVLNPGELCDMGIVQGNGACPTVCASAGCMPEALEGTGCQATCVTHPIVAIAPNDGCCPAGADSSTDSDCIPQCGNGTVESGETCEAGDPLHPCPTADSCRIDNCLIGSITGDAALCTAICETRVVEQCVPGDGCCPSTCTHDLDSDCSASCGNGVVDATAGETCDTGSTDTPCPTACDDGDICTRDYLTGSASNCSASCLYVAITAPFSGDGCCPQGANASNDLDCAPICGNGVVERGELCDLNCPKPADCDDSRPCTSDQVTGSDCNIKCSHDEVRAAQSGDGCCPLGANSNNDRDCTAVCGNGVVEAGEECDGNCPTSCRSSLGCLASVLTGAPCHLTCVSQRITSARNNDGCCPSGTTSLSDNDCDPICGNGIKERGESCDGDCGQCPDPPDACTVYQWVEMPNACNPKCVSRSREPSGRTQDNCCPYNANATNDADCRPVCGNGVVEGDENCDGNCLCPDPPDACTEYEVVFTQDTCHGKCNPRSRGASGRTQDGCCPNGADGSIDADCQPVCGNGVVEGDEVCDGRCGDCPGPLDACRYYKRFNSPDSCHPTCELWERGTSGSYSDGCCPSGATSSQDVDC